MTGTVLESQVCVLHPGQKQSGTIKCPGIGSTALIMVKELLHLARIGTRHGQLNASCIYFTVREAVGMTTHLLRVCNHQFVLQLQFVCNHQPHNR